MLSVNIQSVPSAIQAVSSPQKQNKEKISYRHMSAKICRGTAPMFTQLHSFSFYLLGHLENPSVYSSICECNDTSPQNFLCLSKHSQLPGTFERL